MNYFEILGIKQRYNINSTQLKSQYLKMQKLYHPDTAKNDGIKKEFLDKSIKLNEAYKALQDDHKRGKHILYVIKRLIQELRRFEYPTIILKSDQEKGHFSLMRHRHFLMSTFWE